MRIYQKTWTNKADICFKIWYFSWTSHQSFIFDEDPQCHYNNSVPYSILFLSLCPFGLTFPPDWGGIGMWTGMITFQCLLKAFFLVLFHCKLGKTSSIPQNFSFTSVISKLLWVISKRDFGVGLMVACTFKILEQRFINCLESLSFYL